MKRTVYCVALITMCLAVGADTLEVFPDRGATLQQAMDQARSGDTIRITEGVYYTDKAVSIVDKRNFFVEGDGEVWIICRDVYENVLEISGCEGVSLYNVHAKHEEWLEEYACNGAVVSVLGSSRVEIVGCELNGCGAMGISLEDSQEVDIVGCLIQHNSFTAIYVYSTDNVNIIRNKIFDNATTIEAYQTSGLEMYGNLIAGNGAFGFSGF